ncbi:MAG: glycosyltransferase family 2 protein [Balneolaceae bacterium]|nr:MAG: glycosyltransferase family 2 protein [Balneolaceae bacterium]
MMQSNLFAVVVTFNGMEWISKCLDSLLGSEKEIGIIVVDNASTDGTAEWIRQNYPQIYLIDSKENRGFARANNLGIARALILGAEAVFLLNQDAFTEPETVGRLSDAMAKHPQFGILSPLHLNGDGTALDFGFENYLKSDSTASNNSLERIRKGAVINLEAVSSDPPISIDFVNAAAWLVSKACLRDAGGFCPLFFMYGEDLEYVRRANMAGYKIGVLPGAVIHHAREKKEIRSDTFSMKSEMAAFERAFLNTSLHPALSSSERFLALLLSFGHGFRRVVSQQPGSFFRFYIHKVRLWRKLKSEIELLPSNRTAFRFIPDLTGKS